MKPLLLVLLVLPGLGAQTYQPAWESLDKRPTPAYAEWYWNAMTRGQEPKANPIQTDAWAFHQKQYGAQFPYRDFAPQFRAELFDPDHWADVFARSGARACAWASTIRFTSGTTRCGSPTNRATSGST